MVASRPSRLLEAGLSLIQTCVSSIVQCGMVPRKIGRREGTEAKYGRNSRLLLEGFRCEAEGVEKFLNTHICMCQVRPHTYRFYTYILHTWIPFVCDTSARQRRYHTVVVVSSLRIERQSKSNNQTCWRTKARPSRAKKLSVCCAAPLLWILL